MTAQPPRSYTRLAIAIIVAALVISLFTYLAIITTPASTRTTTVSVTEIVNHTGTSILTSVPTMEVNGLLYYADNVTSDVVIQIPGYSYLLNGSVTFLGVRFTTICPPQVEGCPAPGSTVTNQSSISAIAGGAIRLSLTFPDGTNETIGGEPGPGYPSFFILSQHADPQAGILLFTSGPDKAYLLVS